MIDEPAEAGGLVPQVRNTANALTILALVGPEGSPSNSFRKPSASVGRMRNRRDHIYGPSSLAEGPNELSPTALRWAVLRRVRVREQENAQELSPYHFPDSPLYVCTST